MLKATPRHESQSPLINGYGFVTTPSITPGGEGDASPFVTWGSVDSTPLLLSGLSDLPVLEASSTPFEMPQIRQRETVALKLADKASKEIRKRNQQSMQRSSFSPSTPTRPSTTTTSSTTPTSSTPRTPLRPNTPSLSPAGKALVSRALRRSSLTSDQQLRASYSSPSPRVGGVGARAKTPSLSSTSSSSGVTPSLTSSTSAGIPQSRASVAASPKIISSSKKAADSASSSLTDDLLHI